jgi:hypothetical protein
MSRRHERAQFHPRSGLGQRVMSKLLEGLAYGLASASAGGLNLKHTLLREWRAIRMAEQDRAHLATIVQAPLAQRPLTEVRPVHPPVTFPRSVQPPSRK